MKRLAFAVMLGLTVLTQSAPAQMFSGSPAYFPAPAASGYAAPVPYFPASSPPMPAYHDHSVYCPVQMQAVPIESATLSHAPAQVVSDSTVVGETLSGGSVRRERFWVDPEFLLFYMNPLEVRVPLVTTGLAGGGILGQPDTTIVSGDRVNYDPMTGLRLSAGVLLDATGRFSLLASGFYLPRQSASSAFQSGPDGSPLLARPFVDATNQLPASLTVSAPGQATGTIVLDSSAEIWGAEVGTLARVAQLGSTALGLSVGFRYLDLHERLSINQGTGLLPGASANFAGSIVNAPGELFFSDRFDTRNQFYGVNLGVQSTYRHGRFFADLIGKVALGGVQQTLNVFGATTTRVPGGFTSTTAGGGLLALSSNAGRFSGDEFAVVPEVGVRVGVQVTQRVALTVGYNAIFISNVIRPGDQLDPTISLSQVPVSPLFTGQGTSPVTTLDQTDFWLHGLSLGLSVRY